MTLSEFLRYVATPAGAGAIVTLLMYVIQTWRPDIQENSAFFLSVDLAFVAGLAANYAAPYAESLPPDVANVVWPMLVWAWNYVYYRFVAKPARTRAEIAKWSE